MKTQYARIFSFIILIKSREVILTVCLLKKQEKLRKPKKTLRTSFFSLMLVILIKTSIPDFLIAILAKVQGALRKKQLAPSCLEHFKKIMKIHHASTLP